MEVSKRRKCFQICQKLHIYIKIFKVIFLDSLFLLCFILLAVRVAEIYV